MNNLLKRFLIKISAISISILLISSIFFAQIKEVRLRVDGLACPFCAYGLEKKIKKVNYVRSYDVDMKQGKVFIGLKPEERVNLKLIRKAVKDAGFTLRSISLSVKGKIGQSEEGLVLIVGGSQMEFILFESEAISQKHNQGEMPNALSDKLKKKLIQLKEHGKKVLIEGVVHEHKGLPDGLSVDHLEIIEQEL